MPWIRLTQLLPDSDKFSTLDVNTDLVEYVRSYGKNNAEIKLSSGELMQVKEALDDVARLRGTQV
jgi:hypothetical protein